MTVEELYNLMEKKSDKYTHWSFKVYVDGYVDGINNNISAYANDRYDVEGSNKINTPYGVKDLFKHEVISFYPSCDGVSVKIHKFHGMKYIKLQSYKDENGMERFKDVIKIWK